MILHSAKGGKNKFSILIFVYKKSFKRKLGKPKRSRLQVSGCRFEVGSLDT
jgi:hypothetical protein